MSANLQIPCKQRVRSGTVNCAQDKITPWVYARIGNSVIIVSLLFLQEFMMQECVRPKGHIREALLNILKYFLDKTFEAK